MRTITAILLDNDKINSAAQNAFEQCNELRYLHMDHNFLTVLPRLPHPNSLQSLHLAYNKIQKLTDVVCITSGSMHKLKDGEGNPLAPDSKYKLEAVRSLASLASLDGDDLNEEKVKSSAKLTRRKAEKKNVMDSCGENCVAEDTQYNSEITSIDSGVEHFRTH